MTLVIEAIHLIVEFITRFGYPDSRLLCFGKLAVLHDHAGETLRRQIMDSGFSMVVMRYERGVSAVPVLGFTNCLGTALPLFIGT